MQSSWGSFRTIKKKCYELWSLPLAILCIWWSCPYPFSQLTLASSSSSISGCRCFECLCSSSWNMVLGFSSSESLSEGGSLIQASRSKLWKERISGYVRIFNLHPVVKCPAPHKYKYPLLVLLSSMAYEMGQDYGAWNLLRYYHPMGKSRASHPSGTGTFFWALGATGLSSPANKAVTSSATGTSLIWSFWMYFMSWRMQEA